MERRTVVIVGDTLFAEALSQILALSDRVSVVGCVPALDAASKLITAYQPDVVIVAEADRADAVDYSQLLKDDLDLPIIRANLTAASVQIITSQRIGTRPADLLTAIAELPKRRGSS